MTPVFYHTFLRSLIFSIILTGLLCFQTLPLCAESTQTENSKLWESASYSIAFKDTSNSDLFPIMQSSQTPVESPPARSEELARTVVTEVNGKGEFRLFGKDTHGYLIHFSIKNPTIRLVIDGQPASEEIKRVTAILSRGIVFSRTESGSINRLWLSPADGLIVRGAIKTLLSLTQVVIPQGTPVADNSWETDEGDQRGLFRVRYTQEKGVGNFINLKKQKISYIQSRASAGIQNNRLSPSYLPQGNLNITVEKSSGKIESISGELKHDLILASSTAGHSHTIFSMKLLARSALSSKSKKTLLNKHAASLRTSTPSTLLATPSREEADTTLYRQKLGADTLASLQADLALAEKAGKQPSDVTELYLKFKALIFLHPNTSALLVKGLQHKPSNKLSFRLIVAALTAIATPTAQQALADLIAARSNTPATVVQLIPSLGMLEHPTLATEQALTELAYKSKNENIASTAQLALSIIARTLSSDNRTRAERIINEYMKHFGEQSDTDTMRKTMLVLGNVALDSYLPWLLKHAAEPSAELRSNATFALRFYPFEKAGSALIRAVTSDRDATTRREAARALGFMDIHQESISALTSVYNSEKIMEIRLEALKSLWKWHKTYPEIETLMKQAAEKDESEELRNVAKALIAQMQNL